MSSKRVWTEFPRDVQTGTSGSRYTFFVIPEWSSNELKGSVTFAETNCCFLFLSQYDMKKCILYTLDHRREGNVETNARKKKKKRKKKAERVYRRKPHQNEGFD
jgi:hypothetical protein